jgi:hypothetical protein
MMKFKNLRGLCQQCGGPVEFHAEHVGTSAECPHCGQPTELLPAPPSEEESPVRTTAVIFTLLATLILLGGLAGALLVLKRAERLKANRLQYRSEAATPVRLVAAQEFQVSQPTLDKSPGGSLVHAVGTIGNMTGRQRFGVRVELELFDESGNKLGGASDYLEVLEPHAEWKFRALVVNKRAASAKVAAVREIR